MHAFTEAMRSAMTHDAWLHPFEKHLQTWAAGEVKDSAHRAKLRENGGGSSTELQMLTEEVADSIEDGSLNMAYALSSIHYALGNGAFFAVLQMVGGGLELIQVHNAWIIDQAKKQDPASYHRWGAVYEGLCYPILPIWMKSARVREYNRKLLAWAQEQRSPAGAGSVSSKVQPEHFLSVFAERLEGGAELFGAGVCSEALTLPHK